MVIILYLASGLSTQHWTVHRPIVCPLTRPVCIRRLASRRTASGYFKEELEMRWIIDQMFGQAFVVGAFERDQGHCSVRTSGVLLRLGSKVKTFAATNER
ncbi:hypothetical protein TNCV_2993871 [Trichonephila clavipes]|nr:hypothetical protein TNCV_2993871 [Trichonephila clavipes]